MADGVSFEQTVFINTTKSKLWSALIDPEIINRYYLVPIAKMGSKVNDYIEYGLKGNIMISGEILSINPEVEYSHTFKFAGLENSADNDDTSKVTYKIEEENGLVILILTHTGFKEKNQTYHNVTGGWPFILSNLKTLLETGQALTEK